VRDPKKIPEVLARLQKVWEKFPDLRLGQLLVNAVNSDLLYYKEDKELVDAVEECYAHIAQVNSTTRASTPVDDPD
jgi:uncharacterized protein YihD (DUF1040 family)